MSKVVMVTTLQPFSNYSQFLSNGLLENGCDLLVFSDNDPKNKKLEFADKVNLVWDKNPMFVFQILKQLIKIRPAVVHYQHEINMFGGGITALQFPWLVFLTRLLGIKVITTIHAGVPLKMIDADFVKSFKGEDSKIPVGLLKLVFLYINFFTGLFSNKVIVHTNFIKNLLITNYHVSAKKIEVIPHGVNVFENVTPADLEQKKKYFFYFGYLAKRKGLENVLTGYARYLKESENPIKLVLGGGVIPGQEFAYSEVKDMVKNLGLDSQVMYTGFLNEDALKKYFSEAYVFLIPAKISIAASGPMSVALGFGRCVVASDVPNLNEEVTHNLDGYVVDNANWDQAFSFLEKNPDAVLNFENASRAKAERRSWNNVAKMHLKIYKEMTL